MTRRARADIALPPRVNGDLPLKFGDVALTSYEGNSGSWQPATSCQDARVTRS
jgi:hypothetical protein